MDNKDFSSIETRLKNEIKKCQKGNATLEKRIVEHKAKLVKYVKNPDKFDNKEFLKKASPELREKIIKSRVNKLNNEINKFENNIKKNNLTISKNKEKLEALEKHKSYVSEKMKKLDQYKVKKNISSKDIDLEKKKIKSQSQKIWNNTEKNIDKSNEKCKKNSKSLM